MALGVRSAACACAFALALGAGSASAMSIAFGFEDDTASLQGGTTPTWLELAERGTLTPPDAAGVAYWSLDAPTAIQQNGQEVARIDAWEVALKEDPFVQNNINVTNTSSFTQVYIVSVLMPIPAYSYDEVIFSSVGVTATDSDGDNTLLVDTAGASFYRGRVDTITKLTLDPPAVPITTADCSPFPNTAGCTATSSAGVASLDVAPDVAEELQIILRFALSPGDAVGITSRFEITQAPEPTTGLLLGLGMALLAASRRRR